MTTYWILMSGEKVGQIETKLPFSTIQKSKALGAFAEFQGMGLSGLSIKERV